MNPISPDSIKEIAEQLDCGFRAFIHKKSKELLFVPDELNFPDIDEELWKKELTELENNRLDYYEIKKWTSREAFETMNDFAEQVVNQNLQNKLFNALDRKKPFREFKFLIDNAPNYGQQWFDFKSE
jgi:DNA mismatch repair ATPase MutL